MAYTYGIKVRFAPGPQSMAGQTVDLYRYKSFESARKSLGRWQKRMDGTIRPRIVAWAIFNLVTGQVEEQSGRL